MNGSKLYYLLVILTLGWGCSAKPEFTVAPAPEYDALFTREQGWTGGDSASSLALGGGKVLWLFGDTWIGKVRDGKHQDATLVNNTIALQEGRPPEARIRFYYGSKGGKPGAFIVPADGKGFFWLDHDGIMTERGLFLVMNRIEKPDQTGPAFGFRSTGRVLARVADPSKPPSEWRAEQSDLPFAEFRPDGSEMAFGHPMLKSGGMIYIYGTETAKGGAGRLPDRYLLLARAPENRVGDLSAWTFYSDGKWAADFKKASRLADRFGAEFSVSYQPALGKYVAVYTESGLSKNIMIRYAPAPEGPWSAAQVVFECPEMSWDKDYFCYAAKGHPELSRKDDELLISYVCNAHDFWKMAADARIYRPRFLTITFRR